MDPRTAAHALTQIASFLELRGESSFKVRAYQQAASAVVSLDTDDLGAVDRRGDLASTRGLGPATLAVVRDLIATGESRYLEQLRAATPQGLLDLLRVPGLATARIHLLHETLAIDSVASLEAAVRDGRLARLKGFGPKTAARILKGIEFFRSSGTRVLYHRGAAAAGPLLAAVRGHPGVAMAAIAGSVRRQLETTGDVDIVAGCSQDPLTVAASFARIPGVGSVERSATPSPSITFVDGTRLDLFCVPEVDFPVAMWRATGSPAHVASVTERLALRKIVVAGDSFRDERGAVIEVQSEEVIYNLAGLPLIPHEMREYGHELALADAGPMPALLELSDIRGVLHCHSTWSDGRATIGEMAKAAQARGWSYIGITDHSQAAFYAAGVTREAMLEQHEEIDEFNAAARDFRVLKGVEADILADGRLDYDPDFLDRFDFVVGSVHSRFAMDQTTMTERVLHALDDPRLTILGHPTGRLLLSRDPYAIDMDAVLEKAGKAGVAVELNADPHRLDLDWRFLPQATARGVTIAIGPDAHSTAGLDYTAIGVNMARKGGIDASQVLNARSAKSVMEFAGARRTAGP